MAQKSTGIQAQVVGLIDSKAKHERLMQACRGICGRLEQKLLHRETVYKTSSQPAQPPQRASNYELRFRLIKFATTSEPDKFVQPMSLFYLGDPTTLPKQYDKHFPQDGEKRIPKPTLRKIVEVEIGPTCDDFLKLLGFEIDYMFIRSGHQFTYGNDDRCCIMISELHKMQGANQTPKLETDKNGNPVDNLWLVELTVTSDESSVSAENALKLLSSLAEKLSPYVPLHNPEDRKLQQASAV